ncbi:MAG: CRISPR-associated endonuclease Cas1 [Limnochordales bacterium]|nr:CRISPR-associated endonuclease Cas1 [Limnochordales bacterium]
MVDEGIDLFVSSFGTSLRKKSERVVIKLPDKRVEEVPLRRVRQITVASRGVAFTSDLVESCARHGVPINFISAIGEPLARISSPAENATAATRREQVRAYDDRRGLRIVVEMVASKMFNQMKIITYFTRKPDRIADDEEIKGLCGRIAERIEALHQLEGQNIDEVRDEVLSLEGGAATAYWQAVGLLLRERLPFPGREHRGATDPVNVMLNYGYGILYHQAWSALVRAGLDPYAGFLHTDRSGRPSLVLDFVEEFRQPLVDRVVISLALRGFCPELEDGRLSDSSRKRLAGAVVDALDSAVRYRRQRVRFREVIERQAQLLATSVRGEDSYSGFRWRR